MAFTFKRKGDTVAKAALVSGLCCGIAAAVVYGRK